jgi:glycosyltransferase involved in cell wall biosynthesis
MPAIAVLTGLFPSAAQPLAGLFIRERMFRVARSAPLVVIAPQPWFPCQSLIRRFVPGYRPPHAREEIQDGVRVMFPRFLSVPGMFRWLDGLSMALCTLPTLRSLRREGAAEVIDAHFAYPAGYAAVLLGRWLGMPVSITLRGTESVHLQNRRLRARVLRAVRGADRVLTVSNDLRQLMTTHEIDASRIQVIGNGVDLAKFAPMDRDDARRALGLPARARIIVSVGGLVERKGFHRVLDAMPALLRRIPDLHYVIVGGASPAGDMGSQLREQVERLDLRSHVTFTGPLPPDRVRVALCAGDVFVLATRYEGWANVFLEAMACGLPVVTTRVGGNAEVVCASDLGILVPFGDQARLEEAIEQALRCPWDRERILRYARDNTWDSRVAALMAHFRRMVTTQRSAAHRG